MKKLVAMVAVVAFALGTAGFAFAQAQTTPPKVEEKKAEEKKTEKTADKKMPTKNANGTVKSASPGTIVVAGKDKGKDAEWTFAVDAKTKVRKGGKDVTAADLKTGDPVHVRYMEHEGKAVAQAINVKASGTAKKDEKKDEKKAETKPAEKKP